MPARRRHGLVEQARAHGALGVVEAQGRGDEARRGGGGGRGGSGGGGGRGGSGGRAPASSSSSPLGVGQQSLLGLPQARGGLRGGARVELQGVQKGRARVPKPFKQMQRVPGARRGRGPQRRQLARAAGVPQRELGQVRRVQSEERPRLRLRRRDGARGRGEAREGG